MDTPERDALFDQFRAEGWEEEYCRYRRNWTQYPVEHTVSDYPLLVDAELAAVCNLKCPMCYTITDDFKSHVRAGLMDFDLYKKIIDEIHGKVPALRLSLRGEPTLYPDFIRCIRYAKEKGIREVSFLTNGSRLEAAFFEEILNAGADWITVSVDGLDEDYENIRKPLKFIETLQKIQNMKAIKLRRGCHRPVIKIQSIWPAIRDDAERFYNTFLPYVDLIAFNPLIDYLGKDDDIVYLNEFHCPQHYQRLVIGADGIAMMCSNDEQGSEPVGDANLQSIRDIWHGDKLRAMREKHQQPAGFKDIEVCRKCYLPRRTEDSEKAVINGREIVIENYVNRKQKVGE